ncbi:MAG: hypothetical protein J6B81_04930 [Spirochaetaceae bacterium]|nr:hypothetical protein [Spirochaetaceae bacterium]
MKKIALMILIATVVASGLWANSGVSVGGGLDVNMGSNMEPTGSGNINIEFKPIGFFGFGAKMSAKTDFDNFFSASPSIFARLYPFSNAFAEGSIGGNFSWQDSKLANKSITAGASIGWRITTGNSYIEPKISLDYVFGAAEPFSWAAGIGAGYSF